MSEQLAIIENAHVGMRDCNYPVMWFSVKISEGSGALQVLSWTSAEELIKASGVYDITELNGKPCWVEVSTSTIKFLRAWKSLVDVSSRRG